MRLKSRDFRTLMESWRAKRQFQNCVQIVHEEIAEVTWSGELRLRSGRVILFFSKWILKMTATATEAAKAYLGRLTYLDLRHLDGAAEVVFGRIILRWLDWLVLVNRLGTRNEGKGNHLWSLHTPNFWYWWGCLEIGAETDDLAAQFPILEQAYINPPRSAHPFIPYVRQQESRVHIYWKITCFCISYLSFSVKHA